MLLMKVGSVGLSALSPPRSLLSACFTFVGVPKQTINPRPVPDAMDAIINCPGQQPTVEPVGRIGAYSVLLRTDVQRSACDIDIQKEVSAADTSVSWT